MDQWYGIQVFDIGDMGGTGMLTYYNNSMIKLLSSVYPGSIFTYEETYHLFTEYKWKGWLFRNVSGDFWKEKENQREYLDYLFKKLNFTTPEDWYKLDKVL